MKTTLEDLLSGRDLDEARAAALLEALTEESFPPSLAGALLAALRLKGETPAEVRGFCRTMRRLARRPAIDSAAPLADVVGTGGDGSGSFNLSTGTALLAAACGQPIVKHGNRSVSSRCGSADLLEELGLPLPLDERRAADCLEKTGFTFLFAPYYHPAMKAVAAVRRSLGVRTVFNLLGPLSNPAEPAFHLIGAFSPEAAELMAESLAGLPIERAFVVHGEPGWDEATPAGSFLFFDVRPGAVRCERRDPADLGLPRCRPEELQGGDAATNAAALREVFDGAPGAHRDALRLGAALTLELTGQAANSAEGLEQATAALDDGRARSLLDDLAAFGAEPGE